MTNHDQAVSLIQSLLDFGVQEFCLCAGARSAPLTQILEKPSAAYQVFHFFEERAASFFAMGRVKATGRPVAVVMTSGTAVAECLPAVIESYYQGLPLVVVSADRPQRFRGTGAPQSIEQVGIFTCYVEQTWDLENGSEVLGLDRASRQKPLHINICFEEPKWTDRAPEVQFKPRQSSLAEGHFPGQVASYNLGHNAGVFSDGIRDQDSGDSSSLSQFLNQFFTSSNGVSQSVAILSGLTAQQRSVALAFLEKTQAYFVAEATANLELSPALQQRQIRAPEKTLPQMVEAGVFKSVIRIGAVPTLRFWRDLEEKYSSLDVLSVTDLKFSGLARSHRQMQFCELAGWLKDAIAPRLSGEKFMQQDQARFQKLLDLCEQYPCSEQAWIRRLAQGAMASVSAVYLGNSLPIREWDQVAPDLTPGHIWANRGANGIDGQISSFLGWTAERNGLAVGIFGDLTALYDMAGLWVCSQLKCKKQTLVIINNHGGQIFRGLFSEPQSLSTHDLNFRDWAKMWSWDYDQCTKLDHWAGNFQPGMILEICPDQQQTLEFIAAWSRV